MSFFGELKLVARASLALLLVFSNLHIYLHTPCYKDYDHDSDNDCKYDNGNDNDYDYDYH